MREEGELFTPDGERLDGFGVAGDEPAEVAGLPVRPTKRCKRCGCWLNSHNVEGEYCAACRDRHLLSLRQCLACGEYRPVDPEGSGRCERCEAEFRAHKRRCPACGEDYLPSTCVACTPAQQLERICHSCHWQRVHAAHARSREAECRLCGCRFLPRTCTVAGCGERLTDLCSVCHERVKHMGMTAVLWTLPDCDRCTRAIGALERQHRKVTRLSLQKLISGEEPDIDAMAHLSMTGSPAPLVFLDGRFLEPGEVDALIRREEEA
jgi:hypothetical protein